MRNGNPQAAQRGSVLIIAFFLAIVMIGFASTLIMTGFSVSEGTRAQVEFSRAKEAAESGIHYAAAYLNSTWESKLPDATTLNGTLRGDAKSERAHRFEVTIERADADGADNDLDGFIDESDESTMFEIRSVGSVGNATKTIRVTARRDPIVLRSALYLEDETPSMGMNGAFRFVGDDVGLSGGKTGIQVPGLGTTGDPTDFVAGLPGSVVNKIIGEGANPSVAEVEEFDAATTIVARAMASSPIVLGAYPDGHYGTVDDPKVVVTNSMFDISGSFHGFGLLIIDGSEFKMSGGSLKWTGLVIVISDAEHDFDTGSINILGGMMLAGKDFADDDTEDVGSFNVQYSREAMTYATGPLGVGRIRVFNWRSAVGSAPAAP